MKLIEARLNPVTYNSLQDVEQNSENTHSALNFLTMEVFTFTFTFTMIHVTVVLFTFPTVKKEICKT